jgi:hypothetical protein
MLDQCLGLNSFAPIDLGLHKFVEWARNSKDRIHSKQPS